MVSQIQTELVEAHSDKVTRRLERDMFPWIGGKPIPTSGHLTYLTRLPGQDRKPGHGGNRALDGIPHIFPIGNIYATGLTQIAYIPDREYYC